MEMQTKQSLDIRAGSVGNIKSHRTWRSNTFTGPTEAKSKGEVDGAGNSPTEGLLRGIFFGVTSLLWTSFTTKIILVQHTSCPDMSRYRSNLR